MVKDITAGNGNSNPQYIVAAGNMLYFRANDGVTGDELWKSDGTEGGTTRVKDINPGWDSSYPEDFVVAGSTLYFRAFNNTYGFELWKSNGTDVGTVMVKDIVTGDGSAYPTFMTALNSTVYFMTNGGDGSTGSELWKSDGTPGGTGLVKDINSGTGSGYPSWLTALGNTLYFIADDGINGQELWKTNGTEIGTVMVADLTGDTGRSSPWQLGKIGNQLYFAATTEAYGSELYVYTTPLPGVKTFVATNTSPAGATLSGTVNPNSSATSAQFEYGTTTAYGSTVAVTISPNNDSANHNVSATLAGLTANTLYHFRLKATNAEGSVYTGDGTFVAALSSEARLSSLTLSDGALSPVFARNTLSYMATVPNGITSLTTTPSVMESHATVTVNSNPVISGNASAPINLNLGGNAITIVGTAQNGVATQTYTITVTRQTAYQTWIDGLTGGSSSPPAGDFDLDGLANLLEYAFGANPAANSPGALEIINSTTITPGTPKVMESGGMRALFLRRKDWAASGLTYTVQFSPNLSFWENSLTVPTVIADDGTLQAVTVPFPALINGEPARFFKVQVTGQ